MPVNEFAVSAREFPGLVRRTRAGRRIEIDPHISPTPTFFRVGEIGYTQLTLARYD